MIERYDFFHQACSYIVAYTSRMWNEDRKFKDKFAKIKDHKFDVVPAKVGYIAADILGYLEIKKYLRNNNIPFELYDAEKSITSEMSAKAKVSSNPFDYESMINNYHALKPKLNEAFYKYFNYETCEHNYEAFMKEATDIISSVQQTVAK